MEHKFDRRSFLRLVGTSLSIGAGKAGGELVYEHSVGMARGTVNTQQIGQPSKDKLTSGEER